MLKPHSNPYGYKKLLAYKKSEELQAQCRKLTVLFPKTKTMIDLADQMDRSARSGKQNIVEGWKRNTTKEYDVFLGFSIGAIAELEEDCDDVWKVIYPELKGIKGVMGEKGTKGKTPQLPQSLENTEALQNPQTLENTEAPQSHQNHQTSKTSKEPQSPQSPQSHSSLSVPFVPLDIDKLKFYPLDPTLPPIVQLKLRCKELNFLLHKLQKSLEDKMSSEGTMTQKDKMIILDNKRKAENVGYEDLLKQQGLKKMKDGRIVKRED